MDKLSLKKKTYLNHSDKRMSYFVPFVYPVEMVKDLYHTPSLIKT